MPGRFEGQTAVVTGAGGGIGRSLALGIASEGASIACLDVIEEAAAETAQQAVSAGARAVWRVCDVADETAFASAIDSVSRELGSVDVMLANAGGTRSETVPFLEMTLDQWQTMVDRNLTSAFVSCSVMSRHMAANGGGSIVVVSSQLAGVVRKGLAHYCSAKGGVSQLIRAAATELIDHGIRVNGIAPGPTMTPGTRALFEQPAVIESNRQTIPIGRIAEPDELVGAALYLASKEASYAVGTILVIDGGYTIV